MAAPIFKFKNVRVKLNSTNDTLIYAVDIGRGQNGLDIGVLPEEVSSVILTVQCANTLGYIQDKKITSFDHDGGNPVNDNWINVSDASDLVVGMAISFRGFDSESTTGIILGRTYYIKEISSNKFRVSETFGGATFDIQASFTPALGQEVYIDIDSSIKVTTKVRDLLTITDTVLVKDYAIPPNNAFDPLSGNLALSSKLALYVSANIPGYVEVTVSLLEIANATAT